MQVWGIFSLVFTDSRFRARLCHQGEAECMVITIEDTVLYQQTTWWWCQLDTHCVKTGAFVCELTQCLAKTRWKYFWWKNTGARCAIRLKDRQLLLILRMSHRQFGEKNRATKGLCQEKKSFIWFFVCIFHIYWFFQCSVLLYLSKISHKEAGVYRVTLSPEGLECWKILRNDWRPRFSRALYRRGRYESFKFSPLTKAA